MERVFIVVHIASLVQERMLADSIGHDWWHIWRVWRLARRLAKAEGADLFVVALVVLLHDIADWKFHAESEGPRVARETMEAKGVSEADIIHVCSIIATVSFKGAGVATPMVTLEGKVVQDADRLDAIGALGIARNFTYGGNKNRILHDPVIPPRLNLSKEEYGKSEGTTINHFPEKLLLLKDRMNTELAKQIAINRHFFMEEFLFRFHKEWEGQL